MLPPSGRNWHLISPHSAHDIQHKDTQHNDAQHNGLICDTQHNDTQTGIAFNYAQYRYAKCRDYLTVMLRVILQNVFKLNVVTLSAVAPLNQPSQMQRPKDSSSDVIGSRFDDVTGINGMN